MGILVVGHEDQHDLKGVTFLTARLRQVIEPSSKLLPGLMVVMLGLKRTNVHED